MKQPLAHSLRPDDLKDFVGQQHLVSAGKPLYEAMQKKHIFSFMLWGPPGVGKTTLAKIYAKNIDAKLYELSAVQAGKNDIRKIIKQEHDGIKILFLDEIHRFNKAQQDFLLPFVEQGNLYLIGATTENPSFSVISALLSRTRVFILNSLKQKEMAQIIDQTGIEMEQNAKDWIINMADGDARQALNIIESAYSLYDKVTVDNLKTALQNKMLRFDKAGEEHYNTISAFIKSMRASDVDAAMYYLARMVEAGEDPLFIARRMVIFASEDIGLAVPTALVVANEVFKSCQVIGYPECAINLAHGVAYLSNCKKDRSAYNALRAAQADVKKFGNLSIPLHLRNAPTQLMKDQGYGKGYEMYPDKNKSCLPQKIKNKKYF